MDSAHEQPAALSERDVDRILEACEGALATHARVDLRALRFWTAVAGVKRHAAWTGRFARRIAEIDRRAFLARTALIFPLRIGVALLALGTVGGLALLVAAFSLDPTAAGIAVLGGSGVLIGTTHDLAHLLAGWIVGIRFTHWYVDIPRRPQPGVKIDYESYLAVSPRARAWMHASGALTTKLVPFLAVPIAAGAEAPLWTAGALILVGVAQLLTDVLFSVRAGDWKKFRRELRLARELSAGPSR